MKTKIKPYLLLLPMTLLSILFVSCSTLRAGYELIAVDFDGKEILNNEVNVREKLIDVLSEQEKYTMTGFTRKTISPKVDRTPFHFHSFYIVTCDEDEYFTLSFSGTRKWMRSTGAWAINTHSDVISYHSYLFEENEWDVQEITVQNGINTELTLRNIIDKIDDYRLTYYYKDHLDDEDDMENCNTALQNTLVENNLL